MDFDFITTCNWTSTGTFTLNAHKGYTTSNVINSYTVFYRKKGAPTWSSTNNGQIVIDSVGEWEIAHNWHKDQFDNVFTLVFPFITAIDACTGVYFNEESLGTTIGGAFLSEWFIGCSNLESMPEGFTLPQGITSVGDDFIRGAWQVCPKLTSMPVGFDLPQNLTSVGAKFLSQSWKNCSNLTSMPSGFNLPSGITSVGSGFLGECWTNCTNLKQDGYTEDLVFEFDASNVFGGSCPVRPQSVTGASKESPVRVPVNRPKPLGPVIGEKYPLPAFKV